MKRAMAMAIRVDGIATVAETGSAVAATATVAMAVADNN
jgi:hypothetical protein